MLNAGILRVCHGRPDSEGALHLPGVRRRRDGAPLASRVADRLPRGGAAPAWRLRRVRHRRPVDPGGARHRRWHRRVLQRLPAPGHTAGRGRRLVRRRPDQVQLPRLVLRPFGLRHGGPRPGGVPGPAAGPSARARAGRHVGWLRVREHESRRRAAARVPGPHPQTARRLPPRRDAVPLVSDAGAARELEGRPGCLQRGLPRAGRAPADPAVDRRRVDRLRAVRDPRPVRAPGERTPPAPPLTAAAGDRVRRGGDPRRPGRRARGRLPEGRSTSCAPRGCRPGHSSARSRNAA